MTVAGWWASLCVLAVVNIALWAAAATSGIRPDAGLQIGLSGIYVFGCAFRSAFLVYDIPRIGVVNSWFSSIVVGRSVATLAELAFAAQWAVYLHASEIELVRTVSLAIVPLIVVAEIFSWHAVLTTRNLGHVFENSLWGIGAVLIVICLVAIAIQDSAGRNITLAVWTYGGALYVAYIFLADVPMYWKRWKADQASGRKYMTLAQGFADVSTRRVVSMRWEDWRGEVVWMTLYFSVGVWMSISLIVAR